MTALAAWLALLLVANALTLLSGDSVVATCGGLLVLVFLPGLALAGRLPWDRPTLSALALVSSALGLSWLVLAALLLTLLGIAPGLPLLLLGDLVALGLPVLAVWRGSRALPAPRAAKHELMAVAAILALAAPLRLFGLGYTEFQGDETEVILRALGLVQGLPDVIFYHGKGPAELLVTAALYGLSGNISEASARLPFALFNLLAIIGLAGLVVGWFGWPAGLIVGLLLAANGYFVAFSHIAQYQSLVFLLSVAALECAERYRTSRAARNGWIVLAGLFIGCGTLAHYDALFAGPPVAALLVLGIGRSAGAWRRAGPALVAAAAAGLLAMLLFFGPYLASPLFELATERVAGRVGDAFPRSNLSVIVPAASLYLSAYYAVALLGLAAVGLAVGLARPPSGPAAPSPAVGRRLVLMATLWAAIPLLAYTALVRKPGTHIHVGLEGLAVLAAVGLAALISFHRGRAVRATLAACAALALAPVLAYLVVFFLVTEPEVVRAGLAPRYPLYWKSGDLVPRKERFGFPYQAGWKAVGVLFADGALRGSYDSNENPQITHWYTRDAWRCTAEPRYYLIAENVQDEIEPPRRRIAAEYTLIADITVQNRPKLHIYDRRPDRPGLPLTYAAENFATRFDRELSLPRLDPGTWARGPVSPRLEPVGADFGEARLLGYRLYPELPRPGGVVRLDLYWLPLVDGGGHEAAVRLGRESPVGNGRGPGCDHSRGAEEWRAGRPFVQRHSIPIAPSAAPGQYPLLIGMESAARPGPLPIITGAARGSTAVEIALIEIRP